MCKLWRSFGRTPNCCQIWVSPSSQSSSQTATRLFPVLNLTLFVKQKKSSLPKGLNFCKQWLRLELCLLLQWEQVWALKQWAMREWTGWSKGNILHPWYGQGWRQKTFKHWSVSLVDYTYPVIIYSMFRALISKEYTAWGLFAKWGNLLNFSVHII